MNKLNKSIARMSYIVGLSFFLGSNVASATDWKSFTYIDSMATPAYRGLEKIAKEVNEATNGDITIRLHVGGSLPIKANTITQSVGDGVLDFASDFAFTGNIELGGLIRLPFLMENEKQYDIVRPIWLDYVNRYLDNQNIKLLAEYHYPQQIVFSSKPITSLDELRNLKIRVSSSEQGALISEIGGTPITLATADVSPALQTGVVDGVLTSGAGGGRVWREFFTHSYRLPVNYVNSLIIINKDSWNDLSLETQHKLIDISTVTGQWIEDELREDEKNVLEEFKKSGMIVTSPTEAELLIIREKASQYWDVWANAKGEQAKIMLQQVREALSNESNEKN